MSLFQCEVCGALENTALSCQGFKFMTKYFDWAYAPERKGLKLCSVCGPIKDSEGASTEFGVWHGQFKRRLFPLGEFITDEVGNLKHRETGLSSSEFAKQFPERMGAAR